MGTDPNLYTSSSSAAGSGALIAAMGTYWLFMMVILVLAIVALWKIFTKAGEEGWKSIIPIYNTIILLKIVGRPWWWILLFLIPLVNIVVIIIVYNDLSKSFGHGMGFTLGLLFLNVIFFLILGFGSSRYVGPGGKAMAAAPAGAYAPQPQYSPPPPPPSQPPAPPAPPA